MKSTLWTTDTSGHRFRDLNGNGTMEPYEDSRLSTRIRVDDLLSRMSLEEKAGLLFHPILGCGVNGEVIESGGAFADLGSTELITAKHITHVNVHALPQPSSAARWHNDIQAIAEQSRLGIPVTVSSDPRHAFAENAGVSFSAAFFSQWPEGLGLGAIGDAGVMREFAETARREYLAVGLRAALHPVADLATEPRWARQLGTFGQQPDVVARLVTAALEGFQGDALSPQSVACTTKHFPGGGPQRDGEDPHFPYGKDQIYPGDRLADHLIPFVEAVAAGTSAIMPYYGRPIGLTLHGEPVEEVGFGFNRQLLNGLLRDEMGFTGVILADWELIHDVAIPGGKGLPARAWGVEHLDPLSRLEKALLAGCDQFGGESCPELLVSLVEQGRISVDRLDESARRLLAVKFDLGLFDDPFVDEDAADEIVGASEFVSAGRRAQSRSVTILKNGVGKARLPLSSTARVFAPDIRLPEGIRQASSAGEADVAILRFAAPYSPRSDYFLEDVFRAGTLEFPASEVARAAAVLDDDVPLIVAFELDRPALIAPVDSLAATSVASYGISDQSLIDALFGVVRPSGRLPFDLPESLEAVENSRPDVGGDTSAPIYSAGHGLTV